MARPRAMEEAGLNLAQASMPVQNSAAQAEEAARAMLGQVALLAVPLDTYQKIEKAAHERGMRTAELIQRALVEYIDKNPSGMKE